MLFGLPRRINSTFGDLVLTMRQGVSLQAPRVISLIPRGLLKSCKKLESNELEEAKKDTEVKK